MHAANLKSHNNSPTPIFLWAITGYVVLLTLADLLQSDLLKSLSYMSAVGIFMLIAATAAFLPRQKNMFLGFDLALILYYYGIIGSLAYNINHLGWPVALKMLMGPLFILFGASFESQTCAVIWQNKYVKSLLVLLMCNNKLYMHTQIVHTLIILCLTLYFFCFK